MITANPHRAVPSCGRVLVSVLTVACLAVAVVAALLAGRSGTGSGQGSGGMITAKQYLALSKRRFGKANPERVDNPVWEWMVREGHNPYWARLAIGLEPHYRAPGKPEWCFDRMGAARVEMPDGRVITIGGEHEDFYDPDFCIYNDVVVRRGDEVEIYAYRRRDFPPTDFHTATLIGDSIYLVGSLGYPARRGGTETPVYRLDTETYSIEQVKTTGESPGWIHKHRAELLEGVIEVSGGERALGRGDDERFLDNLDVYRLAVADGVWQRVTDHSHWRQFALRYNDDERAWTDLGWYTGEILKELGYPCELFEDADDTSGTDIDDDDEEYPDRVHIVVVDRIRVAVHDRHNHIRVTVQGELAQDRIDDLLHRLKELARGTYRVVSEVEELE